MQVYSSGLSEKILGNAIKKLGLSREELVIMTKVNTRAPPPLFEYASIDVVPQIALPMFSLDDPDALKKYKTPEKFGIVNQHGLSRKVRRACQTRICLSHSLRHSISSMLSRVRLSDCRLIISTCCSVSRRIVARWLCTHRLFTGHRFDPTTPIEETV